MQFARWGTISTPEHLRRAKTGYWYYPAPLKMIAPDQPWQKESIKDLTKDPFLRHLVRGSGLVLPLAMTLACLGTLGQSWFRYTLHRNAVIDKLFRRSEQTVPLQGTSYLALNLLNML